MRRYLLKDYIKGTEEELQMSLLCLDYLTFPCFNAETSDSEIRNYVTEAYYALHDYAVSHWIDHLQASIQCANGPRVDNDLVETVDDFFAKHWSETYKTNSRIPKQMKSAFRVLEGHDFHDKLLQVYYFLQADTPSTESSAEPLELYSTVRRIRRVLEEVVAPLSRSGGPDALRFRALYGANLFKCPRPSCNRFEDGFPSARERNEHEKKHTRAYRCHVPGCFAAEVGLASEQSLKRHMANYHSDGELLFPAHRSRTVSGEKVDLLFTLARDGDVTALKRHLSPECVSVATSQGNTLLHVAARQGNTDLALTLLSNAETGGTPGVKSLDSRGALVNAMNKRGITPLSRALIAAHVNYEMVSLLMRHGATPRRADADKLKDIVLRSENRDFARQLLLHFSETPSSFPVTDAEVVELVAKNMHFLTLPIDMPQLLHQAAVLGAEKVARLCLAGGATPEGKDYKGQQALILAAFGSQALRA